jgi:hypothetical protein
MSSAVARGSDAPGRSLIRPLTVEVVAVPRFSALCHFQSRAVCYEGYSAAHLLDAVTEGGEAAA